MIDTRPIKDILNERRSFLLSEHERVTHELKEVEQHLALYDDGDTSVAGVGIADIEPVINRVKETSLSEQIRIAITHILSEIAPSGAKVNAISQMLSRQGIEANNKMISTILYRMSKRGMIEREGSHRSVIWKTKSRNNSGEKSEHENGDAETPPETESDKGLYPLSLSKPQPSPTRTHD